MEIANTGIEVYFEKGFVLGDIKDFKKQITAMIKRNPALYAGKSILMLKDGGSKIIDDGTVEREFNIKNGRL